MPLYAGLLVYGFLNAGLLLMAWGGIHGAMQRFTKGEIPEAIVFGAFAFALTFTMWLAKPGPALIGHIRALRKAGTLQLYDGGIRAIAPDGRGILLPWSDVQQVIQPEGRPGVTVWPPDATLVFKEGRRITIPRYVCEREEMLEAARAGIIVSQHRGS
jgi:hypothetical protein